MNTMAISRGTSYGIVLGAFATCMLAGACLATPAQAQAISNTEATTVVISSAPAQSGVSALASNSAPFSATSSYATMSTSKGYLSATKAYKALNKFRTTKKVWYWNANNKTKTKFNTKKSNTLKPLKKNAALEKTAKTRAKELVKVFDHTRPNGTSCFTAYPSSLLAMGENIAYGTAPLSGDRVTKL